jgi:uncharacterized delta-60 repeat protein
MNRKRTRTCRLSLEPLEDRCLLSAGALDPAFGAGGVVLTATGVHTYGRGVAVQTDGKIVVAGTAVQTGDNYYFALARYNADGSLDTSFGSGGKATTDFSPNADGGTCLALQNDGKIVVAGYTEPNINHYEDVALARYNADGSLDTSFGTAGKVINSFGLQDDRATGVAIQTDGKIVVVVDGTGEFVVARYNADGSPDAGFGGGSKVVTSFGHSYDSPTVVVLQGDGKIVVAGATRRDGNTGSNFALARYNANGSLDTSFDKNGMVITDFSRGDDTAWSVGIQSDGKIVAGGSATIGTDPDFALARYLTNGTLDTSFGTQGKVTTDFGTRLNGDAIHGIVLQPDGKIVAAGETMSGIDTALARYNANGTLDTSFGTGGKVVADFGGDDKARGVALQSDGKIVIAGEAVPLANYECLVARFLGDSAALVATSSSARSVSQRLTLKEANPLLGVPIARWQPAGADTSILGALDIHIADLGGTALGLLTVLEHEIGHLLGKEHEASGVMIDTLSAGVRRTPGGNSATDWLGAVDLLFTEASWKKRT